MDTKFYELSQIIGYYRFNPLCVIRAGGLKMLCIITGYGLSQYELSQVWLYAQKIEEFHKAIKAMKTVNSKNHCKKLVVKFEMCQKWLHELWVLTIRILQQFSFQFFFIQDAINLRFWIWNLNNQVTSFKLEHFYWPYSILILAHWLLG